MSTVTLEVEIDLSDIDESRLINELDEREVPIRLNEESWDDLSTKGIPLELVLHELFKNAQGYSFSALEDIVKNAGAKI